ncbi:unnamed protein product [Prorocentrum cordatum]|uniref:Uncharacterized protein n=1 Tax=Prorocentrum cordatum TaxID=2364126 RepID=A0ABN9PEK7_9DINO|nr:unnamed protein product [Polarella glacialis]
MLPPAAALPPGAGELPLRAYSAVASSSRLAVASANPAGALPLAVLAADCRLSSHGLPLCAGAPGHGGVQEAASPASPTPRCALPAPRHCMGRGVCGENPIARAPHGRSEGQLQ